MALLLPPSVLQSPNPLQPLLEALEAPSDPSAQLHLLPALLQKLITLTHRSRYDLFNQTSTSKLPYDVFVAEKVRSTVRMAVSQILVWIDHLEVSMFTSAVMQIWVCRQAIWSVILSWGGYLETEVAWGELVEEQARKATMALTGSGGHFSETEIAGWILKTMTILEQLDHGRTNLGPEVIAWCIAVSACSFAY